MDSPRIRHLITTVIFAVGFVLTALALSARSTDRPVGGHSHDTTPVIGPAATVAP